MPAPRRRSSSVGGKSKKSKAATPRKAPLSKASPPPGLWTLMPIFRPGRTYSLGMSSEIRLVLAQGPQGFLWIPVPALPRIRTWEQLGQKVHLTTWPQAKTQYATEAWFLNTESQADQEYPLILKQLARQLEGRTEQVSSVERPVASAAKSASAPTRSSSRASASSPGRRAPAKPRSSARG